MQLSGYSQVRLVAKELLPLTGFISDRLEEGTRTMYHRLHNLLTYVWLPSLPVFDRLQYAKVEGEGLALRR